MHVAWWTTTLRLVSVIRTDTSAVLLTHCNLSLIEMDSPICCDMYLIWSLFRSRGVTECESCPQQCHGTRYCSWSELCVFSVAWCLTHPVSVVSFSFTSTSVFFVLYVALLSDMYLVSHSHWDIQDPLTVSSFGFMSNSTVVFSNSFSKDQRGLGDLYTCCKSALPLPSKALLSVQLCLSSSLSFSCFSSLVP